MNEMATDASPTVGPMISYEDAGAAADWLVRAFGFRERRDRRVTDDGGVVGHAEVESGDGVIFLATPTPVYQSPRHHRQECQVADRWLGVPWVVDGVLVHVDDLDRHLERARRGGARILGDVADEPYGRLYRAEDIEGAPLDVRPALTYPKI